MRLHKSTPATSRPRTILWLISITTLPLLFLFTRFNPGSYKKHTTTNALPTRHDWTTPPSFCNALKTFPQPFDRNCTQATKQQPPGRPKRPPCDSTRPQFFSQSGEDYYLYTRHFRHLNRPGIYFDIAANDPIIISSTYFLDRCLSWKGVCVEANQKYHEPLHRERSCHLVPTCVSKRDGVKAKFALHGASGGILDTHKFKSRSELQQAAVETKRCTDMKGVTRRLGVREVDFLNVDVEGHEMQVLKGWDWENVKVGIAIVELNRGSKEEVRAFMKGKGFVEHVGSEGGFFMNDPVWVHESVVFGRP